MASSHVEMAASSTFGCILRDHNRRDFCRESTTSRKNIHGMVTCINISQDSNDIEQRTERPNLNMSGCKQQKDAVQESSLPQNFRQSRVFDRWTARQAQDVISTLEKHGNDAELAIGSVTVPSQKESAATNPENLGASSLVQIWEARLGISHGSNRTPTSSSSLGNSPFKCSNDEPPSKSEVVEPYEESRFSHEGSIGDWEPDQITHEAPPPSSFSSTSSSSSLEPDTGKSLRTPRVADIIRRLTSACDEIDNESCINAGVDSPSLERELSVGSNHASEQRNIMVQMTNSLRLRGRQAFQDLLMHMERDRQRELDTLVERQAVSRFSQNGRIQSMLRLKVLQRQMGVHPQEQQRPRSSGPGGSNTSNGSTFSLLREKFKVTSSSHSGTKQEDKKGSSTEPQTQTLNQSCHSREDSISINCETSITSKVLQVEVIQDTQRQISFSVQDQTRDTELKVETSLNSNVTRQGSNSEAIVAEDHLNKSGLNSCITSQEACFEAIPAEDLCKEKNLASKDTYQDNDLEANSIPLLEQQESFSLISSSWYEEGSEDDEEQESNLDEESVISEYEYDCFLGVSRPKSFWEDQRQERYKDVLETQSEDSDIWQLLERRRVSTYLASDYFRDRMNSLMVCHLQRQNHHMGDQEDDMSNTDERTNGFLSSLQQCRSPSAYQQACDEQEKDEKAMQVREAEALVLVEGEHSYSQGQQISNKMEENKPENEDRDCSRSQKRTEEESFDIGLEQGKCKECVKEEEHELEGGQLEEGIDVGKENTSIEDEYEREVRNDEMMEDMEEGEEEESPVSRKYEEARKYFNRSNSSSFRMLSPIYTGCWSYHSCETRNTNLQPMASTSLPEPFNSNTYDHDARQHMSSIDRLSREIELINDLRKQMKMLHQEMAELRNSIYSCMDMQAKLQYSLENEMNSFRGEKVNPNVSRKDMCCVCNEMKVTSLLYRCGHMCTCLECAHELQRSNRTCPICQASILDVVKAYKDS